MGKIGAFVKKVGVVAAAVAALNNPFALKAQMPLPSQRINVGAVDTSLVANPNMDIHLKGTATDSSFVLESVAIERRMAYEENKVISLFGSIDDTTSNKYTMNYLDDRVFLTSTDVDALYRLLIIQDGKPATVFTNSDSIAVDSYDNWTTSNSYSGSDLSVKFTFTPEQPMEVTKENPIRTPYGEELEFWTVTATDSTSRNWIMAVSEAEFKLDFYRATNSSGTEFEQIKDTTLNDILHFYVNTGYNYGLKNYGFMRQEGITNKFTGGLPVQEFMYVLDKVKEDGKWKLSPCFMYSSSKYLPHEGYYQSTAPPDGSLPNYWQPTIRGPPPHDKYWNQIMFIDAISGELGEAKITFNPGDGGLNNIPVLIFHKDESAGKYILPNETFEVGDLRYIGKYLYTEGSGTPTTSHEDKNNFRYTLFGNDSLLIEDRDQRNFNYWQQTNSKTNHYPVNPIGGVNEQLAQKLNLQLFPNPAGDQTTLKFTMPEYGNVNLKLYNALGQQIRRIANRDVFPGENQFPVSTSDLPNGLYFIHIQIQDGVTAIPMMVAR